MFLLEYICKMDQKILEDVRKLIIGTLSFNKVKNCWFSIDILNLLAFFNIKKRSEVEAILDNIFLELVNYGSNFDNLLISAFTNDFLKTKTFNSYTSKPYVNSLSKFIFKKQYTFRSLHPFYSFFNFGQKKESKILDKYTDSFGSNSIFNCMIENDFHLITLGHHYVQSFPVVHHLEYILGAKYREEKIFKGTLSNSEKEIHGSFNYFFRKSSICERSGLTFIALKGMESEDIVKTTSMKNLNKIIYSYELSIQDSANFIILNHSKKNLLVDYFHSVTHPSKKIVTIPDSVVIYKKLLKSI